MAVQLDAAFNYNDIQGLEVLKSGARKDDPKALRAVAQQFESMFISLIMKSMRDATDVMESDLENSYQTKFYRDMYDQQMSLTVSQEGGFGLADVLYEQLMESQHPARPDLYNIDVKSLKESIRPILPVHQLDAKTQAMIDQLSANVADLPVENVNAVKVEKSVNQSGFADAAADDSMTADMAAINPKGKAAVFESPEDFINTLMPIAEKVAKPLNLDPKIMLAQAALETGWGRYVIHDENGKTSNNFFGIKADSRWQGDSALTKTHEYIEGKRLSVTAPFRAYRSAEESFSDYVDFIQNSQRYAAATQSADQPEQYAKALRQAGYATDPNYAEKIIRIANSEWFSQV